MNLFYQGFFRALFSLSLHLIFSFRKTFACLADATKAAVFVA
jgi:hypothetical protein